MSFLNRFTAPLVGLGWVSLAFLIFFILSIISFFSALLYSFRDWIWFNYGVPAPIAVLLFPIYLIIVASLAYYGLKLMSLLLDSAYWWVYNKLHPFNGVIEGEVVE